MVVMTRNGGDITNQATDVLDVNHTRMLAVGYTQVEIDDIENKARAFFLSQFGLNFTGAPPTGPPLPLPAGGFYLPVAPGTVAAMFPYANRPDAGLKYFVAFDSDHEDRTKNFDWNVRDFGMIVLYFGPGSGTFNGGVMNGTTWNNGSVLFYGDYNYLKVGGNYSDPTCNCKEKLRVYSYVPSTQIVNSQGYNDNTIKFTVFDEQGNEGLALVFIHVFVEANGTINQRIRAVVTWNCPGTQVLVPPTTCFSPPPPVAPPVIPPVAAPVAAPVDVPVAAPVDVPIAPPLICDCSGSSFVGFSLVVALLALFARLI
jgi:hypothetical protein